MTTQPKVLGSLLYLGKRGRDGDDKESRTAAVLQEYNSSYAREGGEGGLFLKS